MNPLDYYVITFLNQFAHRSWTFDAFVQLLARNYLLKTGLLTAFLGWAWMRRGADGRDYRTVVVFGLIASCAAVLIARVLSFVVPFRERPLRIPELNFVLPYDIGLQAIWGWSAFPSDNAALYFGLAACLYLVSRSVGIWSFCHVLVVVGFARVYLGFHHPTDILMGASLGIAAVSLINIERLRNGILYLPMKWLRNSPQSFYAAFFFLMLMIATTFEPVYDLARFTKGVARAALHLTVALYR